MNNEIKEIFELYEKQATNSDLAILIKTLKEWYFEKEDYKSRIDKALDKLYCYGEVFDREILKQFQKEMLDILQGEDNENKQ